MTGDKNDNGFKLELEEQEPASIYRDEIQELRLEKLSQRVTLISILIPLMIVVILAVAYLDIKKRVIRTQYTGTTSVQSLSKQLDSRFSSLSLRQAKLESRMEALTKANAALQVAADKNASRLKKLGRTAASAKTLAKLESKIDRRMKTISSSLKNLETQIATTENRLKTKLAALQSQAAALDEKMTLAQTKIQEMEKGRISKEDLDLAIRLEALKTKQALELEVDKLSAKLNKLQKTVTRLRSRIDRLGASSKSGTGATKNTSQSPTSKKTPASGGKASKKIIEQDIKQ